MRKLNDNLKKKLKKKNFKLNVEQFRIRIKNYYYYISILFRSNIACISNELKKCQAVIYFEVGNMFQELKYFLITIWTQRMSLNTWIDIFAPQICYLGHTILFLEWHRQIYQFQINIKSSHKIVLKITIKYRCIESNQQLNKLLIYCALCQH